jgi:hypothetical protein
LDPAGDSELIGLGGLELSGAGLDEAGELEKDVYRTILERLRHGLVEHNITGKCLLVSNPTRANFLFKDFFIPWEQGTLPPGVKFFNILPTDNPHLLKIPGYLSSLTRANLGDWKFETRVLGNWWFEISDADVFHELDLLDCFNWSTDGIDLREKFLCVDVGGSGSKPDRTVIALWNGLVLTDVIERKGATTVEVAEECRRIMAMHNIPIRNLICDSVGLGQGVADSLKGCVQYRANGKVFDNESYGILKDQLFYKLGELVAQKKIRFKVDRIRDQLIEELCAHKAHAAGKDKPQSITPKPQVTRSIGRSPDLADACVMRAWFCYRTTQMRFDTLSFDWRDQRRA